VMITAFLASLALTMQDTDPGQPDPAEAERLEAQERTAAENARRAAEEAAALAAEIDLLQQQLVTIGRRVGASETAALASEQALARLDSEEAIILDRINANRDVLIDVLAAIQRVESQTPPAVLASPESAADAARAASLMGDIAPELRRRAAELAAELDALAIVRGNIENEQATLASTEDVLSRQRQELEILISERRSLEARRRNEAESLLEASSSAGRQARSIRTLIGELSRMSDVIPAISPRRSPASGDIPIPRMRPVPDLMDALPARAPLQTLRFSEARGRLQSPTSGEVYRRFGDVTEDGTRSEGIFIRTRPRAQVVSPFDAHVEFAEPFSTYGGLLILNVGDGYYIVLAGMAVTYASAGQSVLAGEPVGAMPETSGAAPDLYLELRRDGDAVNPEPWLRPD